MFSSTFVFFKYILVLNLLDVDKLATYAPDSEEQQAAVVAIQDKDAFNWG